MFLYYLDLEQSPDFRVDFVDLLYSVTEGVVRVYESSSDQFMLGRKYGYFVYDPQVLK